MEMQRLKNLDGIPFSVKHLRKRTFCLISGSMLTS